MVLNQEDYNTCHEGTFWNIDFIYDFMAVFLLNDLYVCFYREISRVLNCAQVLSR